MPTYEYRVIQMPAQGVIGRLNDQICSMVANGWEPMMMSGDATVNVMMQRPLPATAASEAREHAVIAESVSIGGSSQ